MQVSTIPAVHRIALYDHVKDVRKQYEQEVYRLLGSKCAVCGSKEQLRLRFIKPDNPLGKKYQHSPATLHRRICLEPDMRKAVCLLCRPCRLDRRGIRPTS